VADLDLGPASDEESSRAFSVEDPARIPVLWVSMLSFASVSFLVSSSRNSERFIPRQPKTFCRAVEILRDGEHCVLSISRGTGSLPGAGASLLGATQAQEIQVEPGRDPPVLAGALIAWAACWMRTPPAAASVQVAVRRRAGGQSGACRHSNGHHPMVGGKRHSGFAVGAASAIFQSLFLVLPSNVFDQASSTLAIAVVVAVSAGLLILTAWMLRQHSLRCT